MANVKISELPVATASSALAGVIPINVGSTTHSILGSELLAPIGKVNNDVGFTLAGGTTSKTLTVSLDGDTKDIPTAAGKTAADAIGAATGATTALKLANLASPATNAQQGVALLGASGGAAKLTTMPDGATAAYSNDAWLDGSYTIGGAGTTGSVSNGILTITPANGAGRVEKTGLIITAGMLLLARVKRNVATTNTIKATAYNTISGVAELGSKVLTGVDFQIVSFTIPVTSFAIDAIQLYTDPVVGTSVLAVDWIWIGDYSYLAGSLSEEAARIADQLGDTAGVGTAATATITSNGTNVNTPSSGTLTTTTSLPAADSTFKVGTKTYTWKSSLTPTEGEVLLEATVAACLTNARDAVNGTAGTLGTKHQCTANTLFTATASATILTVTAILRGTVGNGATYEIVAGAGSELTASGALATGGVDDTVTIGGKVYTWKGALSATRVEGEVLVGATSGLSQYYLYLAVVRAGPSTNDFDGSAPKYNIAAVHPLVTCDTTSPYSIISIIAKSTGILGNQITLAKSAATLTLSGTTLTGGKDDVGDKIHTQLQTMPASTAKYGASLLAADGGTTAGTVVQGNDSRLAKALANWTPVPQFGGINDDGTYSIGDNFFVEIGNLVFFECRITWTVKGSKTGVFTIAGLPRNAKTGSTAVGLSGSIVLASTTGLTPGYTMSMYTPAAGTIAFSTMGATGTALGTYPTDANFTASTTIRIRGSYLKA